MHGMTKRELQITDENQIRHILDTAKVLHLGMAVDNEPYVVPMNYGYTMEYGKLTLYLHSAVTGKKLDMIRENDRVFFSIDCDRMPFEGRHRGGHGGKEAGHDPSDEDPDRKGLHLRRPSGVHRCRDPHRCGRIHRKTPAFTGSYEVISYG